MATMNISLPKQMKEWVESRSADGRYANSSDYVRDLIRKDQERAEKFVKFQQLVKEGYDSGMGTRSMEQIKADALAKWKSQ